MNWSFFGAGELPRTAPTGSQRVRCLCTVHGDTTILANAATDNSQAIAKDKVSQLPVGAILVDVKQTALIHTVAIS